MSLASQPNLRYIHFDFVPAKTMQTTSAVIRKALHESDLHPDPFVQLDNWMRDAAAAGMIEPAAMALATATRDGRPSVRTVLLKGIEENSVVFYTNYESRKAKELAENPHAALLFYWDRLERQVRVEGTVTKTSAEESFAYFKTRPFLSRISAWASQQSKVITGRAELERRFEEFRTRYANEEVPLPPGWGGFRLKAAQFEFWQGRENRLHDRLRYRKEGVSWVVERLSP